MLLQSLFVNKSVSQIITLTKDFSLKEKSKSSQEDVNFSNSKNINNDFEKYLSQLVAYTGKHKDRVQKYIKESYYVDFALEKIQHLLPTVE